MSWLVALPRAMRWISWTCGSGVEGGHGDEDGDGDAGAVLLGEAEEEEEGVVLGVFGGEVVLDMLGCYARIGWLSFG